MLGAGRAGRQGRRRSSPKIGYLAPLLGSYFVLAASASDCGFPSYDFGPTGGAAGSAGSAASSGTAGSGGTSAAGAGGTASGGASGSGGRAPVAGGAGEGAIGGEAGAPCVYPTPVAYPAHCFSRTKDDNETDVDCGGGDCVPCSGANTCSKATDCVTGVCGSDGKCTERVEMTYMSIVADEFTRTPKFNLVITNKGDPIPFQTLRIRYYFNHSAAAEPIIALDTQATYASQQSQINLTNMGYRVFRLPPGPADSKGVITDSYLEITFGAVSSMQTDGSINLTQDIVSGSSNPNATFQQSTHYSFMQTGSAVPNNKITIYVGDQLIWGMPPALAEIPDCAFTAGVSLNGPAVSVDGEPLAAADGSSVSFTGTRFSNTAVPLPTADASTTTLLHTGFTLGSDIATWTTVPNGRYWAYAWLVSDVNSSTGELMIQDNPTDQFVGVQQSGGTGWQKIGPYSIDVLAGSVKLSATGAVNINGLELYRVAE